MKGFVGFIGNNEKHENILDKNHRYIYEKFSLNNICIERNTTKKFIKEKLFIDRDGYFILIEGLVLNDIDLMEKYNQNNLEKVIYHAYITIGDTFFSEFRGSFLGILHDKYKNRTIIYNDHIGSKPLYYSQINRNFMFSSDVNIIIDYFRKNNYKYNLDLQSAWCLLTFGYTIEDNTMFKEIKSLIAGNYIVVDNNDIRIIEYHRFDNTKTTIDTDEEIVENIDRLFRQAIKRAYDKDRKYEYKHLTTLSGGLDSRMTNWIASDMCYSEDIINMTFSQSDYLDEVIAKNIARDLKHDWIFKFLDNGLFLKDIEESVKLVGGSIIYSSIAHGKSVCDLINTEKFGIQHSGQFGDAIVGTLSSSPEHKKLTEEIVQRLMYTPVKYEIEINYSIYPNEEMFFLYNRAFIGVNKGLLAVYRELESYSPFYDVDFFEYCLSIPVAKRFEHKIYFKWILDRYPKAAKYDWERLHANIKDIKTSEDYQSALRNANRDIDSKNHMNPFAYWYRTNEDVRRYMDNYYYANIHRLKFDEELLRDCIKRYEKGNYIGKAKVLTLLAFMKIYL